MRIQAEAVTFSYPNGVLALDDVSLTVEPGEIVAIVGQNGAGKTTLVRHFNGLLLPSQGSVMIGDMDTRHQPVSVLAQRVGYVFQNPDDQLFCRTVQEEIIFGPHNLKLAEDRMHELVDRALNLTELEDRKEMNPYDLSPSWRKMVALASVLAMDTPILILDEPTTGQDSVSLKRIAGIISTLRQEGKIVIAITHDIDFCVENFERIVVMGQGKILLDGSTREVVRQQEILAATYVEQPQLTRLGNRLGFVQTICNSAEFIEILRDS